MAKKIIKFADGGYDLYPQIDEVECLPNTNTAISNVSGSIAAEYNTASTYNTGNYCTYQKNFYKCKEDGVTGAWDATKWDSTTVGTEFGAIEASPAVVADEYDSTETYDKNDYCIYDDKFYRCKADGTTGTWDASKWDETKVGPELSTLKAEKADKTELPNRNYLDNPFFTINQRGATTYTVGAYGVDRWKLVSGTATVSGGQITLNGTLRQILEFPLGTNDFKCSVICASGTATATYDDTTKYFDIVSSGGVIKCAKLELGSVSTLAMDAAPNYAEELLKCQRYYRSALIITNIVSIFNTNYIDFLFSHNEVINGMREIPSCIIAFGLVKNGSSDQSGFTFSMDYCSPWGVAVFANKNSHGLPQNTSISCEVWLRCSADL